MNEHAADTLESRVEPLPALVGPAVPDLIGLSLADACEAAAWAGAQVNAVSAARARGPWGVVVAQSPSPGARLQARWQIHVLVAVPAATPVAGVG